MFIFNLRSIKTNADDVKTQRTLLQNDNHR